MDNTENLGLPYIMAAQAQKHVTHNEALRMLDGIVQLSVVSELVATPPASPNAGDRYIVPSEAIGDWVGQENRIAAWQDGAWAFLAPVDGWLSWVAAKSKLKVFSSGQWQDVATGGDTGGGSGTPGGISTQIQFNDGGAFAGAASVFYNKISGDLAVEKTLTIENTTNATTGVIRKGTAPFIHAYGTNNLFFGGSSGNFTVTGSNNAAFGAFALTKVTTGQHNLAFGAQALNEVTTGIRNVSVGSSCLTDLIGGSYNIGVGASALQKNVTGSRNLGLGYQSLYNCSASDNISVGYRSGFNVSSGTYNIFIGRDAGGGIETGGGNVVIGRQTGLSATLANTIILATGGGSKRMEIDSNGHTAFEGAVRLKSHTVTSLPSASVAGAGAMIFATDEIGGAIPVFSDGVDWRRVSDRSTVS